MLFVKSTVLLSVMFALLGTKAIFATTFKSNDSSGNPLMQMPEDSRKIPRVRIALEIQPYQKALMRRVDGNKKIQFLKDKPIKRVLRARIKETNHFYLDDWHIETIPVAWNNVSKILSVKIRFYKQFGQDAKVEEYVGESVLKGYLNGTGGLYVLNGYANSQFRNKNGDPVIDVAMGIKPKPQAPVAKSPELQKKATR